jgi:hypothetical protein
MIAIEAGIGYTRSEVDSAAGTLKQSTKAHYVNAPISIAGLHDRARNRQV